MCTIVSCAVANIFAARYYRLLQNERKIFLGFRGIDSLAAIEYIELDSPQERIQFYSDYWESRDEERKLFEERIEYAFRAYGKYAPLSDDRIQIYVRYGSPSKREEITPEKKLAIKVTEKVNPAEIWTYKKDGLIFDFVRIARAYKLIARSEFGDRVSIPYLREIASEAAPAMTLKEKLLFDMATGRFRQKKNLTRLEIYLTIAVSDTSDLVLARHVRIYDRNDSLIDEKHNMLIPQNIENGIAFDEVNFWLEPEEYRVEVEMIDTKHNRSTMKSELVSLIEYQDDAKEISDLIPSVLIDNSFTHEKFDKPVGRVIPLVDPMVRVNVPFYFYAEVYNLETQDGMHRLTTTYEVTNKEKMKRAIVDVMIKDYMAEGNVAYLGAEYHPMDLAPGHYMIVLRAVDLLSGKERTAVAEFELRESFY
jgi:GWxTD domain-containing protein